MTTDKTPATLATVKRGGCVQWGDAARVIMSETTVDDIDLAVIGVAA